MHTDNFELIRNAKVDVEHIVDSKKNNVAVITVNDKYQHRFSPKSRISKHLEMMDKADLQERLNGGAYMFIDDRLVDFRDGMYHGFIHDDNALAKFMELIGYQVREKMPLHRRRRNDDDERGDSAIVLRKVWDSSEIIVPGYREGGEFNSELSFVWNPFSKTINQAFDLVRLICTNGMVGLTSFLNTKVPVMNRWEEHMDIASRQTQNKVTATVIARIQAMQHERASVADCMLMSNHANDRLHSPGEKLEGERQRLLEMYAAVNPMEHLKDLYQPSVFYNSALGSQLPSHLTTLDLFNFATELRTHTSECKKSSQTALDKFANGVLFEDQNNVIASASAMVPAKAAFSSPERAFFGQMH